MSSELEGLEVSSLEVCFFVCCSVFVVFEMRNLGLKSTTKRSDFEAGF